MTGMRIDFASADAARFNALRDEWRAEASSSKASRAGMRVATVLPGFVNRGRGYAFPTDQDLAEALSTTFKTVQRGLVSLENMNLIERQTIVKRDEKGEAIGKLRRIYLTLPSRPEVNGQEVNGHPEVNGQKREGERTDVRLNIPDNDTHDNKIHTHGIKVISYAHTREGSPVGYRGDDDFLDAFDRTVIDMTDGKEIGAGEIDRILQTAFDQTTDSSDLFMPFHWRDVCRLRQPDTANWFRSRVGQLIHRRAA